MYMKNNAISKCVKQKKKKMCGCANARIKDTQKKHNKKNLRKKREAKEFLGILFKSRKIFIQIKYNPFCSLTHSTYVCLCISHCHFFPRFFHFLSQHKCIYVK